VAVALAFPIAGLIGWNVGGRVYAVGAALVGGTLTEAGLGAVQSWAATGALGRPAAWIGASAVGYAIGLAAGAALVGYDTDLGSLALMGLVRGIHSQPATHSRGAESIASDGTRPMEGLTITDEPLPAAEPVAPIAVQAPARRVAVRARPVLRYLAGVLVLAAAYFIAGRASLALQYEGPVAAIWLPVGVGAASLYLAGLRWWPGVLVGDVALADPAQPLGSALGITAGNMADILVIAVLLRLLLGPRGALDRLEQVAGMLIAIAAGAAITATAAMLSLRAGGVIESSDIPTFWRSWFLADASGALIIIPLALAWTQPRSQAWRGHRVWEGALMIGAVVALSTIALSAELPLTYMVFPALIWAALRFGQRGATLAVAVAAGMAVGITANEVGAFVMQSITDSALTTQLYIAVAALTMPLPGSDRERARARRAGTSRGAGADRRGARPGARAAGRRAARQRTEPPGSAPASAAPGAGILGADGTRARCRARETRRGRRGGRRRAAAHRARDLTAAACHAGAR
jgi:integral membrane sensor domain MASE1